jgi:hypothetical protein
MNTHQVVTKDYPENLAGGIMICGINFGYSVDDEKRESTGIVFEPEHRSFFSDKAVNDSRFRNRVLTWLSSWGFTLVTRVGEARAFERSFFQTNWLDTQTRNITSNGTISVKTLVQESDSFLNLVQERTPSVVIFIGADLIEAFNDIQIRERVVSILGARSGNAEIYRAELPNYRGTKFKLLAQRFGETQIISLPHPQARGLSDEYMAALKPPSHILHGIAEKMHSELRSSCPDQGRIDKANDVPLGIDDPLLQAARLALSEGEECPVSFLQIKFRIGYGRAVRLCEALKTAEQ